VAPSATFWESDGGKGPERVRVVLGDGRSLEGYKRESTSANPELVILDVIAAFDKQGNESAPRPSDSFILRSEISSMETIDDASEIPFMQKVDDS
jgi:hypothetical protein